MSSGPTPAFRHRISRARRPATVVIGPSWKCMSGRRLHTRPATALISAGGCGQSRARSARVTMIAAALSVSTQQSRRCRGFTIQRLASTSSTVTRFLYSAFGLQDACSLCATLTIAACSGARAVLVHVAHEGRREPLRRAGPAVGLPVQLVASDRRRAPAGAAHAQLAVAVHRPVDHHRAAHAGLDHAGRDADQRLGARAAAPHVHVEVEADAEIARHLRALRRVHQRIRQHAVDVGGAQPGVGHGVADRGGGQRPRGPARAAHISGLADADDRVPVAQGARAGCVDLARHGAQASDGISRPHFKSIRPGRASVTSP